MSEPAGKSGHGPTNPSAWIRRFAGLIAPGGGVLDLACGAGRHVRLFLECGHRVVAVDRDVAGLADLAGRRDLEIVEADLEDGGPWPLPGRSFAGVVVTNYLHRPLFPHLLDALAPDGVLLYETFARGNERFRSPSNPDFLLAPGELLDLAQGRLLVVAYEHGEVAEPRPAVVQRICAVNADPERLVSLPQPPR
ncbi:MAG: class I SAM-dependent methyltransferase [Alphaproteobacteria bacterium]|nr:class I SAM-dependent methyltransferase [Alphaproteobacteria bacterium]